MIVYYLFSDQLNNFFPTPPKIILPLQFDIATTAFSKDLFNELFNFFKALISNSTTFFPI